MGTEVQAKSTPTVAPAISHAPANLLQRKCACGGEHGVSGECEGCRKKRLGVVQRLAVNTSQVPFVPPIVHEVLHSPGQPLDIGTRAFMEPRFGHDFSQVRIHTHGPAAESARSVNALAYTVGSDIVFGAGQYAPTTNTGRRLLAHELTHTVQQASSASAFQPQLSIGAVDTPAEVEADHVADRVIAGAQVSTIQSTSMLTLRREVGSPGEDEPEPDFNSPQHRGRSGRGRAAFIDAGRRGEDQVRVAIIRYLCDCVGRNVTETHASSRLTPRPGITLEWCRGRTTLRLVGEVEPSSLTTGRATVRGELNVAPEGGTGARVGVEGELRNTGDEPEVGGRADLRLRFPGGEEVGVGGDVFRGTESGEIDWGVELGGEIEGYRIGARGTNLDDPNQWGVMGTFGGPLPGQDVEDRTCRECRCPIVYECFEDIPPRDYEEPVTYTIEDRNRLRYYYSLDTNQDTRDSVLRSESTRMLGEVARRVTAGARIQSVTGYASPEDNRDQPVPNEQLSLSRAERLRSLLLTQLGTGAQIPEPQAGVELFGRVATIAPGSRLADAMLEVGFGDPEDVTTFLMGSDIPNPQLSQQFLDLLNRVTAPEDRLRLFGIDSTSPAAPRLLAAIQLYVANNGRGRRPWETIFGYLRFATVELATTRTETRMEDRRTSGSLTAMSDSACQPYARQAERESLFGPSEPEPENQTQCPGGDPQNLPEYENKCDYE